MKTTLYRLMVGLGISFSNYAQEEPKFSVQEQINQVRMNSAMECFGARTAPAVPGNCMDSRVISWFADAEVLAWHTVVSNTEYVYRDNNPVLAANGVFPFTGRNKFLTYNLNWGVAAGLGYIFNHDSWELYAHYMWFSPSTTESTSANAGEVLIPLRSFPTIISDAIAPTFNRCDTGNIRHKFTVQDAYLELRKPFFISSRFAITPLLGIEALWFTKHQRIIYAGGGPVNDGGLGDGFVKVLDSSNFWGVGPRVGINTTWYMSKNFNLFVNSTFSSLYGRFEIENKQSFSSIPANRFTFLYDFYGFAINQFLRVGVGYETYLGSKKDYYFKVRLAYDNQYFISLDQMLFIYPQGLIPKDIRIIPLITSQGGSLQFSLYF